MISGLKFSRKIIVQKYNILLCQVIHYSQSNLYQRIPDRNFDLNYLTFLFIIDQQSRVFKSN